jgi:SSS family solute:Na+ symporter
MGTAIGRDFVEKSLLTGRQFKYTVGITRIGIMLGVIVTVILAFKLPDNVIAVATAIFFGLCASTFLPAYIGTLFWKGMTKKGAIASMFAGFLGTAFWLLFIHQKEAAAIGLCKFIFDKPCLAPYPWTVVDPIVVILPISLIIAFFVSMFTKKMSKDYIEVCFKHI